jgi:uncharacterized protein YabN with tetrapyrrole methylase and pyrophosphatase domain
MTMESRAVIESADQFLFLVTDPVAYTWCAGVNSNGESLHRFYSPGKSRLTSYLEMVEQILLYVRQRLAVCVAFYGHPGIFAFPAHEAIRRARSEGFRAKMLPGISAEDCLFADLGIDPATCGCQSFDATEFLFCRRQLDPSIPLILWQIGLAGEFDFKARYSLKGLEILVEMLLDYYDPMHDVTIYEASRFTNCEPTVQRVPLKAVLQANITSLSTLYVPPKEILPARREMAERLEVPWPFDD